MTEVSYSQLVYILKENRFNFVHEKELQAALEQAFDAAELTFEREVVLSKKDRIDFLFEGGLGVEVKIDGSLSNLIRQLHRYVAHDQITSLLVVTNKSRLTRVPALLNGKTIHKIAINRDAF